LISNIGATEYFVLSAASYVPFIGIALWILPRRMPAPVREAPVPRRTRGGIADILRQPHLRGALLTVLVNGTLCAPLVTFTPVLVREVFHGDASRFSTSVASFGVGGLLGAVGMLAIGPAVDRRRVSSALALVSGAVLVLTALDPWFWGLPPLLTLVGASMTASNVTANSLLQATASPRLLGQTVSLFMLAMRGGISIGSLITGVVVGLLDVQHALLIDGVLALVLQAAVAHAWMRAPLPEPA
jgi:predicted MFS family arabinose efflux permease